MAKTIKGDFAADRRTARAASACAGMKRIQPYSTIEQEQGPTSYFAE